MVYPDKITYTAMWKIERVYKSIVPVYVQFLHLMSRAHTDTASLVLHSAESKRLGNIIQMGLGHRDPPAFAVFAGTLHPWSV